MSYSYKGTITIDHTKCGSSDSSNFTVLFSVTDNDLRSALHGGKILETDTVTIGSRSYAVPADLIFTSDSAGSTLLSWEIESWNQTTGTIVGWIKVGTLSHSSNTVIYVWAGNSSITTFQGGSRGAAWDSNFVGVYHLADGTTLYLYDSTSGANDGTAENGPTAATGQIGGAVSLVQASTEYITLGTSNNFDTAAITYSAWVKANSLPDAYNCIFKRGNVDVGGTVDYAEYFIKSNGKLACYLHTTGGDVDYDGSGSNTLSTGTWYHVVMVFSSSVGLIGYVNGASDGSASSSNPLVQASDITTDIGYDRDTTPRGWDGWLDEVRVSSTVRSADWILSEYNNQNSPATFSTWSGLSSNGNAYTQSFAASMASFSTSTLSKSPGKSLSSSTASMGGTASKSAGKNISGSMPVFSGTVSKKAGKSVLANMAAFGGSVARNCGKALAAANSPFIGALSKSPGKGLLASTSGMSGATSKGVARGIQGSLAAFSATVSRQVTKSPFLANMSAFASSLAKNGGKVLAAAVSPFTATIAKTGSKSLSGSTAGMDATVSRQTTKSAFSASMTSFAGTSQKNYGKAIGAAMSLFSGNISKSSSKHLSASTIGMSGSTTKSVAKSVVATMLPFAAGISKSAGKGLAASMELCAVAFSGIKNGVAYFVSFAASMASFSSGVSKQTGKSLQAGTAPGSAAVSRATAKQLAAGMAPMKASIGKGVAKRIDATIASFAGGVSGSIVHAVKDWLVAIAGFVISGIVVIAGAVDQETPEETVTVGGSAPGLMVSAGSVTQGLLAVAGSVTYGLVAVAGGVDVQQ